MTIKVFIENGQILTFHTSSQQATEWLESIIELAYEGSFQPVVKIED